MTGGDGSRTLKRDRAIFLKWISGTTQRELSEEFGLKQQRISDICTAMKAEFPARRRSDVIERELALLDYLRTKLMEMIAQPLPPCTTKDGILIRDENQQIVRDAAGWLAAIDRVYRNVERVSKLLGLDAPIRTSVDGSVTYTINGVDVKALT